MANIIQRGALCSTLFTKYYSSDQIKNKRWARHLARMVERRGAYRVLVEKREGGHRSRMEDNSKMDFREVGGVRMDSIDLGEDRDRWRALVCTMMNLRVPQNAGNFLTS